MGHIIRGIKNCCLAVRTVLAKIRWRSLSIDGFLRKRFDTEIIIKSGGRMKLGHNVRFKRNVSLGSIGADLQIGNNVFFNRNCIVACRKSITIEDDVIIGPNVVIYDHDHIFSVDGIEKGFNHGSVIIERGCWIAANVTILRNTHIGECCVIGAGVVVKGDIPPHSLVKGSRELIVTSIE